MKTDAGDIDKRHLAQAVNAAYGLDLTSIAFLPKGEDAYVYVGQGADAYFVRAQSTSRAKPLEQVYAITSALHTDYGLTPIVAPIASRRGTFTLHHGRYVVSVFPFIQGRTLYDQGASDADLIQAAGIVAALHRCHATHELPSLGRESFANPFEAPIRRALQVTEDQVFPTNHYRRDVYSLLAAERSDLLATLAKMERMGARARELATERVITHGDANLDNLLTDEQGRLHLTDWGEIALGPPERDLSFFTGERFEVFLRPYAHARGRVSLHAELFAFYFYRWAMQEIADYTTRILFEDLGPEEHAHAWEELQPYLPIRHDDIAQGVQAVQAVLDRM